MWTTRTRITGALVESVPRKAGWRRHVEDRVAMLLFLAASALVACLVVLLVRLAHHFWRMHRLTAKLPGPPAYPFIGSFLEVAGPNEELFDRVMSLVDRFGYRFKLWIGPFLIVFVLEAEDLQVVLTSPHLADKPLVLYRCVDPVVGTGIITLNGQDYRRHRKAITTSLHPQLLQEFVALFDANSRQLVEQLEAFADSGEVFNVTPLVGRCASNTLCQTVLTSEAPGLETEKAAFVRTVQSASRLILFRALRPWYNIDALFAVCNRSTHRQYKDVVEGVSAFATKVLERKLAQGASSPSTGSTNTRRKTFLDQFLTSSEASVLDRRELLDELKTLLLTGTGTSMDFQSFFLLCMALHPHVQQKVQQELDDVFGLEPSREVLASDLPYLPYLESALKETLRYFSPAPIFVREAAQDVELPSGQVLPQGCNVLVLPGMAHRNPRHFPDPHTFDPERFSEEQSRHRHPYAFIPFSAGLRYCIGQRYGMMFAKTVAASVLRRFDVLPDPEGPRSMPEVPLVGGISLSVRGGARIKLRRRTSPALHRMT